jgi:ABC-type amino acid transport system permease subunit
LARLSLGSVAGLPLGLMALSHSDPTLVRALAGTIVLGFAALLAMVVNVGAYATEIVRAIKGGRRPPYRTSRNGYCA